MDEKTMRCRIHAYDFSILEMGLYLDAHCDDMQAMEKRREMQEKRAELVAEYERQFGPYIVTSNQVSGDRWTWVCNPWPWDYKEG